MKGINKYSIRVIFLFILIIGLSTVLMLNVFGVISLCNCKQETCNCTSDTCEKKDVENVETSNGETKEITDYSNVNNSIKMMYEIIKSPFIDSNDKSNFYQNKLITLNDLDANVIIAHSILPIKKYDNIKEATKNTNGLDYVKFLIESGETNVIYIYDYESLNSKYKFMFGLDKEAEFKPFSISLTYCGTDGNDKSFKCVDGQGGYIGDLHTYSKFIKAVQNGNNYILYERMAACDFSDKYHGENESYQCVASYLNRNNSAKLLRDNVIIKDKSVYPEGFDDFGQLYKHTFNKNSDGSYYWYSSEPVDSI